MSSTAAASASYSRKSLKTPAFAPDALRNDIAKAISHGQVADAGLQMLVPRRHPVPQHGFRRRAFKSAVSGHLFAGRSGDRFCRLHRGADLIARRSSSRPTDRILGIASIALAAPSCSCR